MYTLQPLKIAECRTEQGPKMFHCADWDKTYTTFFYFWYVEGPDTRILIDTGVAAPEAAVMPTLIQEPEWRPEARLRQIRVDPRSVDHLIITHLHFDHFSSCIDLFPNARLYLQRREYDTAVNPPHPFFVAAYLPQVTARLDGDLRPRLELIDGDAEILPGVRLLWLGGHTPGLQGVMLPTRFGRNTCLTSDLCFFYRNFEQDHPIGFFSNLVEIYQGMARVRREADHVFPAHDPRLEEQFPLPAKS
jgi:glyoxylase-like metal-dependent hydrolase (beta-lactamase superfamily II)